MFFTLNQFLQRVWYVQEIEVRRTVANGKIVLAGKSFMIQRDPVYREYENFYINSIGADDDKLVIVIG